MRIYSLHLTIGVLLVSAGLSCTPFSVQPEDTIGEIRFIPGTTYMYEWRYRQLSSSDSVLMDITDSFYARVASVSDTVGGMQQLIRLEAWPASRPASGATYVWYRQSPDSLEEVAYVWPGRVPAILPKYGRVELSRAVLAPVFAPLSVPDNERITADSIIVRADSRLVLRYPARRGVQWVSFVHPFLQTREVVGIEKLQTPVGEFTCLKILTHIPEMIPSLVWYDYMNRDGLIARTISNTFVVLDQNGMPRDTVRSLETLLLTSR